MITLAILCALALVLVAGLASLRLLKPRSADSSVFTATRSAVEALYAFDYKDPEVSSKIKSASDGKIKLALDTMAKGGSSKIIAEALSSEGGKIATVLPYSEDAKAALGSKVTQELSVAYDLIIDARVSISPSVFVT